MPSNGVRQTLQQLGICGGDTLWVTLPPGRAAGEFLTAVTPLSGEGGGELSSSDLVPLQGGETGGASRMVDANKRLCPGGKTNPGVLLEVAGTAQRFFAAAADPSIGIRSTGPSASPMDVDVDPPDGMLKAPAKEDTPTGSGDAPGVDLNMGLGLFPFPSHLIRVLAHDAKGCTDVGPSPDGSGGQWSAHSLLLATVHAAMLETGFESLEVDQNNT